MKQVRYIKKNILFCFLLFISSSVFAIDTIAYKTYYNSKFQYQIDYPAGFNISIKEAPNDSGQTYVSQDGHIKLTIWGAIYPTSAKEGYLSEMEQDRELTDYKITYSVLKKNYYVISGLDVKHNKIFYMKSLYGNKGNINFYIEYPSDEKNKWNEIVNHIANSLKYVDNELKLINP